MQLNSLDFYCIGPENVPLRKSILSECLIFADFCKEKRCKKSGPALVVPYKQLSLINEYLIFEFDCMDHLLSVTQLPVMKKK